MRKLFLTLLLSLFLVSNTWAVSPAFLDLISSGSGSACDTSNIIFWWRCEAFDFSGTNGTLDYSAGDDIALTNQEVAINAAASYFGTGNGLDMPSKYDWASFDTPSVSIDDEGRMGFWLRITTFVAGMKVFKVQDDGNNLMSIRLTLTDELRFSWKDNGTARTNLNTVDANLSTSTWYFVETAWKTSTNYREVFVDGVSKGSSSATINSFAAAVASITFGDDSGYNGDIHVDNFILSTDSTVDLYTDCRNEEEWPN